MPENVMTIQVKRKSKKSSGFEVEKRDDGHFYVTAVPEKSKSLSIGDRVLEINGIKCEDFPEDDKDVNALFDVLLLGVIPNDDDSD